MINSVKARTPLLALILFVFSIGSALAQNKVVVVPMAEDIGDIAGSAGFLVMMITDSFPEGPPELCKPRITQTIDCGDGSGGWVENTYVVIIEERFIPAGNADFFQGDTQTPLLKNYCSASSITIERVGVKIVGNKKEITYKVTVFGGRGGEKPISIEQYC